MVLLKILFPLLGLAASYDCSTEFGETLPLGASVRKASDPDRPPVRSLSWNEGAGALPGPSRPKERLMRSGRWEASLETRYLTHPGPSFQMEIACPPERKCGGRFTNGAETLLLPTVMQDKSADPAAYAELKLGSREHLGLIVRVGKGRGTAGERISASGELKIYREDPLFIQDIGADRHLALGHGIKARLAAIEIKIRCERKTPPPQP